MAHFHKTSKCVKIAAIHPISMGSKYDRAVIQFFRKQKNFKQISSQMELKIKEEIKREILRQTILFTEHRIKKNISKKHNDKFVEDSLNKLTGHLHQ